MNLTPDNIYRDLTNNRINKITAYNLLISLIENSENETVRLEAILNLEKIGIINDDMFTFLENLLISDSDSRIRNVAAKLLTKNFNEKAINPLNWAIRSEINYECLITIIKSLENIDNFESKLILANEIKKIIKIKYLNKERRIENKKFKKVFKKFIKSKKINNFSHKELAEILLNYLTINNLIKQYSNVYYEVDPHNGLIRELDLSNYLEYEVKGTPFEWKNKIQSTSDVIGLKYLKSLKKIDLSNNSIENVKQLIHLKELTHLILTNNNISEKKNLNYILSLPNLQYLDLRGNPLIKEINPSEIDKKIKVLLKDSFLY
jgi:hypothetical protein